MQAVLAESLWGASLEDLRFEAVIDPGTADGAAIDADLHAYNLGSADFDAVRRFGCYARLESGALVVGALARWWGTACELQQPWVDEAYRRRGIGANLVRLRTHGDRAGMRFDLSRHLQLSGTATLQPAGLRGRM
jgi:hypothetical protein